jgi:hypothetical protein
MMVKYGRPDIPYNYVNGKGDSERKLRKALATEGALLAARLDPDKLPAGVDIGAVAAFYEQKVAEDEQAASSEAVAVAAASAASIACNLWARDDNGEDWTPVPWDAVPTAASPDAPAVAAVVAPAEAATAVVAAAAAPVTAAAAAVGEPWWVDASHGVSPSVPPGLCEDPHLNLFPCPAERGEEGRVGGARGGFRGARRVEGKKTVQLYLPASPALLAHATATPAGEIIQPDLATKAHANDLFASFTTSCSS